MKLEYQDYGFNLKEIEGMRQALNRIYFTDFQVEIVKDKIIFKDN